MSYLAAGQLVLGAIQTGVALNRLNQLSKQPLAQYSDNVAPFQQNIQMYENQVRNGLDPNTINLATNTAADQNASTYRRIQDMTGGQGASAFARIAAMDRVRLANSLAGMSAQERRAAMASLAQSRVGYANQMNRDIAARQQQRMAQEQAWGGALKAGTYNLQQAFDYGISPNLQNMIGSGGSPVMPTATPTTTPTIPVEQMWGNPIDPGIQQPIDPNISTSRIKT